MDECAEHKKIKQLWIGKYEIYSRNLLKNQLGIDDSCVNSYINNMSYSVCRDRKKWLDLIN